MSFLTDLYNGKLNGESWKMPSFTRTLPNQGGTYQIAPQTPGLFIGPQNKVNPPAPVVTPPAPTIPTPVVTPVQTGGGSATSKYINPETGNYFTPQEYANHIASRIPVSKGTGDITQYAGDAMTRPDESAADLTTRGRNLSVTRNDLATGAIDPYKVGAKSGIAYSPQELAAIEKAYAGIYDPALNDVFTRLEAKKKLEEEEASRAWEKEKMALQFGYEKQLKQLDKTGGGSGVSTTGYIRGENPIVDSYVDRINNGELATDVLRGIAGVDNQWLRDKVSAGITATKYDSAKAKGSLETANMIGRLLLNPELSKISGFIDQTGVRSLWGEAATAKALYNQVNSKVQLIGTAELAKGQGAISDYERSLFANAATSAKRALSDEEFRSELVGLKAALQLASGMTAAFKLTDLKTGETRTYELNRDGVIAAEKNGLVVEAIDDSFSNQ